MIQQPETVLLIIECYALSILSSELGMLGGNTPRYVVLRTQILIYSKVAEIALLYLSRQS